MNLDIVVLNTQVHLPTCLFKNESYTLHQLKELLQNVICQKYINHCNNDSILGSSVFVYLYPNYDNLVFALLQDSRPICDFAGQCTVGHAFER